MRRRYRATYNFFRSPRERKRERETPDPRRGAARKSSFAFRRPFGITASYRLNRVYRSRADPSSGVNRSPSGSNGTVFSK